MSDSAGGSRQQNQATGARHKTPREKEASSSEMSVYKSSAEESVRYKGSNASSVYKGSEEYFEYSCDPCNTMGDHEEALGFCTNCDDYLCGACFKSHSKNKASRNHALLDKDNMPKITVKLCDPCKTDGDEEEAAGYCTDCGEYLCVNCFRSHSRNKASRQHVLLDKDNMPEWADSDLTSSVAKMNINTPDADSHKYNEEYTYIRDINVKAEKDEKYCYITDMTLVLDKDNMPEWTDGDLTSSVAKMNINTPDADSQKYNEEYTYIRDINVKAEKDEKYCYITDMTLVGSTELVLADFENKSLKLIDPVNNVIKDSLRLETFPDSLTTISQDQVAVILQDKFKIRIISVAEGLSEVRTLNTNGNCVDVQCVNGNLYVSFWKPVKFQSLQLTGVVQKTISPDSEVLKHCTLPRYITVSPDESMIYASDLKTNKVMCIDMNGNMISMFQGELDWPADITISSFGTVYLCNTDQHVVYKMTSVLSEATVILGQGDGLLFPEAMCFNTDKQQLYISSGSEEVKYCNSIKVFKWK